MIDKKQLAADIAATMTQDNKKFFMHLFEQGDLSSAKTIVKASAKQHLFEQQFIGSHATTSEHIQNGITDIAYGLLKNNNKLAINEFGEIVEIAC